MGRRSRQDAPPLPVSPPSLSRTEAANHRFEPGPQPKATHTCPLANGIRRPSGSVNVVPPSAPGRDQCTWYARPSRSTTALPLPTVRAYGGLIPSSRKPEVLTLTFCTTTVLPPSWPPSAASAGLPSIHTRQRCCAADHRKLKAADWYATL